MGGSKPLKSITEGVGSFFGQKTSKEKAAEEAQKVALAGARAEADKQLQERESRMKRKQQGRASLLSGNEMGVAGEELKKTLG